MNKPDTNFAKLLVFINASIPGALLLWDAWNHQLGANPVNSAILTTGMCALIFLALSLLVTPLRQITGLSWLFHFRRMLGLFSFFYALAHFSIFFLFDRQASISSTLTEMTIRPYLVIGSICLFILLALAATSTAGMIRRLGSKRWLALHRLVYLAAILAVTHFYMQVKSDILLPVIFAIIMAILLGYRIIAANRPKPRTP